MSIKLMSLVWESGLDSSEKFVALAYADFANDDGVGIYPSMDRVAWKTSLSKRTVQRLTASLRDAGILVTVREASGRPGETNEYRMVASKLPYNEPFQTGDNMTPVTGDNMTPLTPRKATERGDTVSPEPSVILEYKREKEKERETRTREDLPHPHPSSPAAPQAQPSFSLSVESPPPPPGPADPLPQDPPTPSPDPFVRILLNNGASSYQMPLALALRQHCATDSGVQRLLGCAEDLFVYSSSPEQIADFVTCFWPTISRFDGLPHPSQVVGKWEEYLTWVDGGRVGDLSNINPEDEKLLRDWIQEKVSAGALPDWMKRAIRSVGLNRFGSAEEVESLIPQILQMA